MCVSHMRQAQKSCHPLAHAVFFRTWLPAGEGGENAASSTDPPSWVRNIAAVVGFTDFRKIAGLGIRIDSSCSEQRSWSSLSEWRRG